MKKTGSLSMVLCLLWAFSLFMIAGSLMIVPSASAETLKIGLITSITGPMAPAFKPQYDAAKPTEELMNQRGGVTVKGKRYDIKIIVEDDQSSPPGAVAAANKLIQDGVKFLIAPMFMVSDLAIAPITEEAKVFRMKPFGLGPEEVNPDIHYGFYSCSSLYNIEPSFDYLTKTYPKAKRIAIIMPDDPGAKTARDMNEKEIKKRGLELVFVEAFKIGTEDYYPILTKALEKKPDAIDLVVSIVPWSVGMINQSRELGFNGPVFSPGLFGDINLVNGMINKKYANDLFDGGPNVLSDKMLPIVKDLRKLVDKTKTPFLLDSILNIDSLYPMLQCIEKAQSLNVEEVAAAINDMEGIDTIWGKGVWGGKEIFGVNHVIKRPNTISRIVNGKVECDFVQ